MLQQALRRLGLLLAASAGVSAVVAIPVGAALGASVGRAVSVAWYLTGSILILGGFLVGNRGPARPVEGSGWAPFAFRSRMLRWASREEQEESINFSAILIVLGFVLLVLGVAVDPRHSLI